MLYKKKKKKEECFTNLSWQSNHKQISKRLIFCSQIYMLWNSIIYYVEILFSDFFMSWRPWFIHSFIYKWDKIVSLCLLNGCGCFLKCMTNMRMIDNSCKSQFYSAVRLKVLKPESDSDRSPVMHKEAQRRVWCSVVWTGHSPPTRVWAQMIHKGPST